MKYLVVIDMQNDFIDGALGSKDAQAIVPNVINLIASGDYSKIYFTRDSHYADDPSIEWKLIPPHCVVDSDGRKIKDSILNAVRSGTDTEIYDKSTFGSRKLSDDLFKDLLFGDEDDSITIVGLCTDICVISNALMLRQACPDNEIEVIANCCAGTTPEKHEAALSVMESNCIKVVR